ncbi:MAG TPA: addiction module protein [Thermoanaerobaculia bacterium]
MSVDIDDITERALMLSPGARAQLAEILLESLDYEEDFVISPEWMAEIRRRCREIDSGEVELLSGEEALAELQKKYS